MGPMPPPWVHPDESGTRIVVWVVPGSSRDRIDGTHGDALKVRVAAAAERGRATAAVERLLRTRLGVSVEVVHGATSRRKTLLVRGMEPTEVARRLAP